MNETVQTLSTAREAKEFLIERIVSQAQRDGIAPSDIERKMLYFCETGWTLPEMAEINARFEYDPGEFCRSIPRVRSAAR